jgi:hypothetical protein
VTVFATVFAKRTGTLFVRVVASNVDRGDTTLGARAQRKCAAGSCLYITPKRVPVPRFPAVQWPHCLNSSSDTSPRYTLSKSITVPLFANKCS